MQVHHPRPNLAHSKECKIRIVVAMEKDENKHRVRKWYAAKGIDEGASASKIMMKESQAKRGGTSGKHEPRATSSDVHMTGPSSSSNMAMRRTTKRHDDEPSS